VTVKVHVRAVVMLERMPRSIALIFTALQFHVPCIGWGLLVFHYRSGTKQRVR
jgi:hypothetical protein